MALGEVGAAVERGHVARQDQRAGSLDLVREPCLLRPAPADHEVADVVDGGATDCDPRGLDQGLGSAADWPAVIDDLSRDRDHTPGQGGGARGQQGIRGGKLSPTDAKQGGGESEAEQRWAQKRRERGDGHRRGDCDHADHRPRGQQHDGRGQRRRPGDGDNEPGVAGHRVTNLRATT